jgi:hypothetical protein
MSQDPTADADPVNPSRSETAERNAESQRLPTNDKENPQRGLNPLQVVGSVFAAGLGVQSSKNRERDFKQGRAGTFIIAGLLFTALFIGTVYTIVSLVLSSR